MEQEDALCKLRGNLEEAMKVLAAKTNCPEWALHNVVEAAKAMGYGEAMAIVAVCMKEELESEV